MTLYIVGTPIGNLSDVSQRALDTLRSVSIIAAEDTRVTSKLLARYNIHTKLTSCHGHNERGKARWLVSRMMETGGDVALVSDAGMPAVSDPGGAVAAAAREAGIRVECVPGPSAVTTVLALTGWDFTEFAFYGFLPREKGDLRSKLSEMSKGARVAVVFESPRRVESLLAVITEVCQDARVFIANDLTKTHEWTYEGTAADTLAALSARENAQKGEYCLAIQFPAAAVEPEAAEPIRAETWILDALQRGVAMPEAVEFARSRGVSRNEAYRASVAIRQYLSKNNY
ncbi:MAG: 16S rRNA (cytidine(1402)-2'-O)-methyltransferase [Oscillospiraceae bacterium]|jgi:16S rRNA (cytidine1402-2'-O)-methyltransferase|nr:16S rRNA (cytidine(1402)-2'-O)-methyltransferase [Oscillospiraceae bacterium]